MLYSCIIIDDEPFSVNILKKYCQKHSNLKILATFTNSTEALTFLKKNSTDLIFLDIMMPGINGFQLLDH